MASDWERFVEEFLAELHRVRAWQKEANLLIMFRRDRATGQMFPIPRVETNKLEL